ncbi:MAG TPA: hypothetical protein VIL90_09755, partial [Puia sp.]
MKNFYTQTVAPCRKNMDSAVASEAILIGAQLRGVITILSVLFFFFISGTVHSQNCPSSGTTVVNTNENTYFPGTQASVPAGATSITLGPIGAGTNFASTPIAIGDIILIIQMQGAQILVPASTTSTLYGGNASGVGAGMITTN